ncbi:PREDICTED: filament-like plant protein 4 isoform X2 [Camelina sativa]|nr:PREDICTED: filament-like plant protein 4 isoform X2 [Camelina sativa]XP_019091791.1 PREDICTED: filament-like plant protein 4 isoform X2 [Camelina sativa]
MDRKSWPWKKKSSEKAATVTEVLDQENGKKPNYIQISFDQYSNLNGLKDEVKNYEDKVTKLEDQIKDLDLKLSTANADITAKEVLVKQHSKVAEEAVTGWEKAEAEASALKTHLETVTLAKLTVEDRAAHLDGALKECMRQIRSLKEENEQKLHDVISTKTNQMDNLRAEFESRIGEYEQELLRCGAENDALSRSLQERSNMLMRISEEKSQAESEIEHLKNNIESCEREINTLKYETHVITKELEIRNEEKNMSMRSAEAANKQHLEGVKKIAKLEAECQRLRTLVRKKLPGPAALAQMKMEVESLGRDYGQQDHRQRRSPARPSSPLMSPMSHMSQVSEFSLDNMQKFHKENDLLTERLLAMEEETKMLKEALAKRNSELQVSRNLCAKTSNRLQALEAQMMSKSPTKRGFEMPAEIFSRQNASNPPSMASMSEDGNEDARSIAGSLMSEFSHSNKNNGKIKKTESANQLELMDDFLEMEKLACLPNGSNANGSTDHSSADSDAEIQPATQLKKRISNVLQSLPKDAAFEKILAEIRCAVEDAGVKLPSKCNGPNVNGLITEEKEIAISNETTEEKVSVAEVIITQELADALSQILQFVTYLSKEATACSENRTFSQKVQDFSVTFDRVLGKEKTLVDFLFDLSRVLVEASELKIDVLGYHSSTVEIHSPDCIDKVALPENKALQKESSGEHYQNGACSQSSDSEIPDDCNGTSGYETKLAASKFTLEEFEGLRLEKEKAETNLASCEADLEATKTKLQETEQLLAEVKSELESAQKSSGMAETQLKCMVESYRSLETRSSELEIELTSLKGKIENLEDELQDEKEHHQEALAKCQELEEQLQRNNQNCPNCSVTEADPKSKQDNELAAAADKLAECQETILLLGKQLKSMCPQTEQVASSASQEQALNPEEDEYASSTNPQDNKLSSPSEKETSPMKSPVGSKHRHTKSNSSSSSSGLTPEKHSRGFSRFFSTKAK